MEEEGKKSKLLVVIFWLSALGCFAFGYYNTVLGLRTFKAFSSNDLGSWFLALIPLVMVFGGYLASVQGRRKMLYIYLAGEILFFVFNLTYLYPQYLGRTLVHEETKALKDSVSVYQGKLDKIASKGDSYSLAKLQRLREFQSNLLTEIKDRNGFGQYATEQLKNFNELAGTSYTPERYVGKTSEERQKYYNDWKEKTDVGIRNFIVQLNGNDKSAEKLVTAKYEVDDIVSTYSQPLEIILEDNSDVSIEHEAVANNPQIALLKELTTKLDKVANDVNSVKQPAPFNLIVTGKETIAFPKTQKLGTFEHTIISVKERLNKLDTWGVIIICFFFDLLGPFLFYFYLRNEDDYEYGSDEGAFDRPWWKRLFGID
ncbi:MAG: hypothetical protein LBS50_09170 [Prevotellaceae bacterium]|jgi:hypothetical protein|nr:hypothetical protein [Prevotellaceae bacterium]